MSGFDRLEADGILLLGCGKMGSAMMEGWLAAGLSPASIHVIDPNPSARLRALEKEGLHLNAPIPESPALCLVAVKPQMMGEALPAIAALGGGGTLVVSIAAGTTLAQFERTFGPDTPIIRTMPNTPAAIGEGITAMVGNARTDAADLDLAETVLSAIGQTVRLASEDQIDAVTGVSGSGPAYVFHMIECLAAAGVAEGLPADMAMQLAKATVRGAGLLASAAEGDPAQLRANVTSPNGTTQAGLAVLMDENHGLPPLIRATVAAAAARSRELSED
ncbi:pyrroline-5-carboxylate reductase [Oceanibium sediminis]|uniref:pyrroline-5-carboxylate reductase n=1 Tax=Oceanibium sediminis TaxID=2026339 RepID=UPI000DD3D526|nr:pyrroline-5-carboxylate reductase [Oceanibium sediminis]